MLLKTVYESGAMVRNLIVKSFTEPSHAEHPIMRRFLIGAIIAGVGAALSPPAAAQPARIPLDVGWTIQSSAATDARGDAISQPGFRTDRWRPATVPGTVVGALVDEGRFPNPYTGMNLRAIPGTTYPIGAQFALLPIPADSPYKPSWWYRREFDLPSSTAASTVWLAFNGINYRANIWVNGTRIATSAEVAGAFRRYEFDITRVSRPGAVNAVAVEVFAPEPRDLAITWVDWNPTPPDKNMGLWGDAFVSTTGPVAIRHLHVITKLDLPSLDAAHLTVTADLWNATDRPIDAIVRGAIDTIAFSRVVPLAARERTTVRFAPADTPQLNVPHPHVWWPYRMGDQHRYSLSIAVEANGAQSDRQEVRFGIDEFSS